MISLAKVLSGKPILLTKDIYFHQPTLQEIVDMTEVTYWGITNIWTIKRRDMISQETPETQEMDDFTIWKHMIMSNKDVKRMFALSCYVLLKKKVEFFDISGTIYIGEEDSGMVLDNTFYLLMKELCLKLIDNDSASEKSEQYQETEHMSERERQLIEKMRASEKKLEETKNPNKKPEDYLGNKILGLVAIGKYDFDFVYKLTMLQFNRLLSKCVELQSYELRTMLAPYMSSDDGQEHKFWLD
jgi:hypothetical protein